MQVGARSNQDRYMSCDLSSWNQQGSTLLRSQTMVLPVDDTFLYVEPIYIQATSGGIPQLKKIVLATGNTLIYTDTYDQALAQLSGAGRAAAQAVVAEQAPPAATPAQPQQPAVSDPRLELIRAHLRRDRELCG